MTKIIAALCLVIATATSAVAQQQLPLPKQGGCPPGFRESGSFCVPGEDTRNLAVPRQPNQGCPAGWVGQGSYCTRPSR